MVKKLPICLLSFIALTGFHPSARASLFDRPLNVQVEPVAQTSTPASRTAEVSGVFGSAFADSGEGDKPLRTGAKLIAGTTLRTDSGAAMDVYLGKEAGVIRLTQNTTVRIERLANTNGQSDVYLHLQRGSILGNSARHASSQIKTAVGIADVGSSAFRLHSEGYFVVVSGAAHFAHVPATGEPKLYSLHAPPAVYFSPTEGVKPAPNELVREVVNQSKARLGQQSKDREPLQPAPIRPK